MIPQDHPVQIANPVIEQIPLLDTYSKEGHPGWHPKVVLKAMAYAYMDNIYSNQKTEKSLWGNINFLYGSRAIPSRPTKRKRLSNWKKFNLFFVR